MTNSKKGPMQGHKKRRWLACGALMLALVLAAAATAALLLRGQRPAGVQLHFGRPAQRHTVAVDAGHGGMDSGAVGLVKEVEVTQATAAALLALLEADGAYMPVQVHADDEKLSPRQRTDVARQANAELLLSLHANRDGAAGSNGFECFAVPPGRDWHDESLRLAETVCARMAEAGARLRGENGIRYAYYRGGAKMMKESSDTTAYGYPTFGVLATTPCPAVLIEQCFITNAADLDAWGDADGCAAAAWCYYLAICDYFGTVPIDPPAQQDAAPAA